MNVGLGSTEPALSDSFSCIASDSPDTSVRGFGLRRYTIKRSRRVLGTERLLEEPAEALTTNVTGCSPFALSLLYLLDTSVELYCLRLIGCVLR